MYAVYSEEYSCTVSFLPPPERDYDACVSEYVYRSSFFDRLFFDESIKIPGRESYAGIMYIHMYRGAARGSYIFFSDFLELA